MFRKRSGLLPFALSLLFLSTTSYANDDEFLTIDDILNQAKGYENIDSGKRTIREGNNSSVSGLNNIKNRGGIVGGVKEKATKGYESSGSDKSSGVKRKPTSGDQSSETVDDINYAKFDASRIEDFEGKIVGYKDGVPIICPNPDPKDIHPDVEFTGGETPKISVPIKFRNFNMTISSFTKTTIQDKLIFDKDFIVSYPYEADAYNDREEVKKLHDELMRKRAFASKKIDTLIDNFGKVDVSVLEDEYVYENIIKNHSTGYQYIVQILEVDDKNKRLKMRIDYSNRAVQSYVTERFDISDDEFKDLKIPIISEKDISQTFYIPIKNREDVTIKLDNKEYVKVKFNNFNYDAARVEIDDLDAIAKIEELKELKAIEDENKAKQKILDDKLKYFDDVEKSISKL